jgi:2-keto-4-pentenoate hydratase/2-oxohepta-3-ene-1,7-dioic acid hydratase in catechol pathway
MKLARFTVDGRTAIGVVDAEKGTVQALATDETDMVRIVEAHARPDRTLNAAGPIRPLAEVSILAPLHAPRRNIICVGKNYREHAVEFARSGFEAGAVAGAEIDPYPAVFSKPASTICAATDPVSLHAQATSAVDYEGELAFVVGKRGKDIRKEDAYAHVWGYVAVNDVTARDRQKNHKQWFLGKALDGFCPMGPWIATADEVDPENLSLKTWVNGELRQNANTRDLLFDIPTLIATISSGLALEPGDVIATGTPAGVGIGMKPPVFLKTGDVVTIEIAGLGRLNNRFY